MNIMEVLVGPIHSATGKSEAECGKDEDELKQEEDGTYADPDLLSYIGNPLQYSCLENPMDGGAW